jgi:hypothetical protein
MSKCITVQEVGTPQNPHTVAPADWKENGVEYGAWCMCSRCGRVSQSTFVFDFYADEPGDALRCEICTVHTPMAQENRQQKNVREGNKK